MDFLPKNKPIWILFKVLKHIHLLSSMSMSELVYLTYLSSADLDGHFVDLGTLLSV